MIRTALTTAEIAVAAELAALEGAGDGAADGAGAVVSFTGHVRADDGVTALWLEHHPRMTPAALDALAGEAMARWPLAAVVLVHRVGEIPLGGCIVLVAVASPHRDAAFDAARYLIDRLKTDVPLWKRETLADGATRWVAQKAGDVARSGDWAALPPGDGGALPPGGGAALPPGGGAALPIASPAPAGIGHRQTERGRDI